MISFFPVHRPRIGISVRAHALDLVEIRRRWRRPPIVRRLISRPLPTGLLTPSATALNISNHATFVQEVRALLADVRERTVAIDLPIASGVLGLFHFETFPASPSEQEALLRWRFRQEEHVAANDLHIVSRVFRGRELSEQGMTVLALAVRRSVLEQYHQVCEEVGLLPVSMSFSTLHLLDLYRRVMPNVSEVFFAHRTSDVLLVLAFRHGRPLFLRVKPLRRATIDLKAELLTTLRYFESQFSHRMPQPEAVSSPLYIVEEPGPSMAACSTASAPSSEVWTPIEHLPWTVEVTRVNWMTAPITSRVPNPEHPPFGALASIFVS